jgi:hypothetical protein
MQSNPIETHSYDGRWQNTLEQVRRDPLFQKAERMASELGSTSEMFTLYSKLTKGQQYFNMIASGQGNWDSANGIDAKVLLCFLSVLLDEDRIKEKEDMFRVLSEQLQDMSTGPCPQGRTTRLIQVIFSFTKYSHAK